MYDYHYFLLGEYDDCLILAVKFNFLNGDLFIFTHGNYEIEIMSITLKIDYQRDVKHVENYAMFIKSSSLLKEISKYS